MKVSCELCVESDGVVLTDGLLIDRTESPGKSGL